ncbi:MAG: hypothetical protein H6617_04540 [Bdellovibrionaceae bacterium]|nr:hypothetical protein [Pseudobdellovibrionaceae bacterium]
MAWIKTMALAACVALSLTGCDLMKPVKQTNAKMDRMLEQMMRLYDETFALHVDEKLAGAALNFREQGEDYIRIRALHIFLETGNPSEVLWLYMGLPRPIMSDKYGPIYKYASPGYLEGTGLEFSYENVTYVYGKTLRHQLRHPANGRILYSKAFNTLDPEFYEVLSLAVEAAVEQILLFHKSGYANEEARLKNLDRAIRVYNVGTAVQGARILQEKADLDADGTEEVIIKDRTLSPQALALSQKKDSFARDEQERIFYANSLRTLLDTLGMKDHLPKLATLVENRLGLGKEQWDYPNP